MIWIGHRWWMIFKMWWFYSLLFNLVWIFPNLFSITSIFIWWWIIIELRTVLRNTLNCMNFFGFEQRRVQFTLNEFIWLLIFFSIEWYLLFVFFYWKFFIFIICNLNLFLLLNFLRFFLFILNQWIWFI